MRLLTICPSRGRPEILKRMLLSFFATKSEGTHIVVYVSNDDPKLDEYNNLFNADNDISGHLYYDCHYRKGNRLTLIEVLNYFSCMHFKGLPYYQEINDDHVYITDKWDEKLISSIKGIGMSWGKDGMNNKETFNLPTGVVMSGDMIKALGFFFPSIFKHTFCDNALLDIGRATNTIFYNPDVTIEHRHYIHGKANIDDNYKYVMSSEAMQEGKRFYEEWLNKYKDNDIERVNNAKNRRINQVL